MENEKEARKGSVFEALWLCRVGVCSGGGGAAVLSRGKQCFGQCGSLLLQVFWSCW